MLAHPRGTSYWNALGAVLGRGGASERQRVNLKSSRRRTLLALVVGSALSPLLFGFLCFPLVAPPPAGVVTPVPLATFAPTVSASVAAPTPGAPSNLALRLAVPAGSTLPIGAVSDMPAGWTVASDSGVTNGSIVGSISGFMTVVDQLFFDCATRVDFDPAEIPPSDIRLLEATTNTSSTVSGADTNNNGAPDVVDDSDLNGLPDGVDEYPAFLNTVLPGTHRARYFGQTEAAGVSDLYVNVVVDELAFGGPYRIITFADDPTAPPESATSQFCAPQSFTLTLLGTSANNPATIAVEGGQAVYRNPPAAGSYTFSAQLVSEFDRDNDGVSNGLDDCPAVANASQSDADQDYVGDACDATLGVANFDVDGDGLENGYDNCIFVANSATLGPDNQADSDFDDIGNACDPNPAIPDGPNYYLRCTDPVGIGQSDPGGASCVPATPPPTPTPKNPDGDTDNDTIPNYLDPDDDNDGCTDVQELGPNPGLGGRRNPHNHWDFYDANGNKVVDLSGDIFAVASAFDRQSGDPGYSVNLDRSAPPSPAQEPDPAMREPWDMGAPDGIITLSADIFGVALQFDHTCT